MKKIWLSIAILTISVSTFAQDKQMHHDKGMHHSTQKTAKQGKLTEAGNDIFGTIAETIKVLNANPNTDWSKVDLETLRQHLLDMRDMSENIKIHSQTPIKNGLKINLSPTTWRAKQALKRIFMGHPILLKKETGWVMTSILDNNTYTLIITGKASDVDKIRGLGYIGIMANGNHHQPHHLSMARGQNPHKH